MPKIFKNTKTLKIETQKFKIEGIISYCNRLW